MIEYNNEGKADDADIEEYNTLNTRAHTYEIKFNQKETTSSGKKLSRNQYNLREYNIFVTSCSKLFHIIGYSDRIKGRELSWGVKMTDTDW